MNAVIVATFVSLTPYATALVILTCTIIASSYSYIFTLFVAAGCVYTAFGSIILIIYKLRPSLLGPLAVAANSASNSSFTHSCHQTEDPTYHLNIPPPPPLHSPSYPNRYNYNSEGLNNPINSNLPYPNLRSTSSRYQPQQQQQQQPQ